MGVADGDGDGDGEGEGEGLGVGEAVGVCDDDGIDVRKPKPANNKQAAAKQNLIRRGDVPTLLMWGTNVRILCEFVDQKTDTSIHELTRKNTDHFFSFFCSSENLF